MTREHATPALLKAARAEVVEWLRRSVGDPVFLQGDFTTTSGEHDARIFERFLTWAEPRGFAYTVGGESQAEPKAIALHWTHRGYSFVGFAQPPSASTVEEAQMLASAALLRNHWCRQRLDRSE